MTLYKNENAVQASKLVDIEKVSTNTAEEAVETVQAGNATNKEYINPVAKDSINVQCHICDWEFRNARGLNAHKGRVQKKIFHSWTVLLRNKIYMRIVILHLKVIMLKRTLSTHS